MIIVSNHSIGSEVNTRCNLIAVIMGVAKSVSRPNCQVGPKAHNKTNPKKVRERKNLSLNLNLNRVTLNVRLVHVIVFMHSCGTHTIVHITKHKTPRVLKAIIVCGTGKQTTGT